jgi:hypothetical protein
MNSPSCLLASAAANSHWRHVVDRVAIVLLLPVRVLTRVFRNKYWRWLRHAYARETDIRRTPVSSRPCWLRAHVRERTVPDLLHALRILQRRGHAQLVACCDGCLPTHLSCGSSRGAIDDTALIAPGRGNRYRAAKTDGTCTLPPLGSVQQTRRSNKTQIAVATLPDPSMISMHSLAENMF